MKTGLIIALDVKSYSEAVRIVDDLSPLDVIFKVGSILYLMEGNRIIDYIHSRGKKVFLDLKFFDIPNTLAEASFAAASLGIEFFTIHLLGGREMIRSSIRGVEEAYAAGKTASKPVILGVTVLTSMDDQVLSRDLNIQSSTGDSVLRLARIGFEAGIRGFVCSPLETPVLRKEFGDSPILVTPGVRLSGDSAGDQKRVSTPSGAAKSGSTYVVMGRSILDKADRRDAVQTILQELARDSI